MDSVLDELTNKVEKAVSEINRLQGELDEFDSLRSKDVEKMEFMEHRLQELEGESNNVRDKYNDKLSGFSGRISNILKKLDTVF